MTEPAWRTMGDAELEAAAAGAPASGIMAAAPAAAGAQEPWVPQLSARFFLQRRILLTEKRKCFAKKDAFSQSQILKVASFIESSY